MWLKNKYLQSCVNTTIPKDRQTVSKTIFDACKHTNIANLHACICSSINIREWVMIIFWPSFHFFDLFFYLGTVEQFAPPPTWDNPLDSLDPPVTTSRCLSWPACKWLLAPDELTGEGTVAWQLFSFKLLMRLQVSSLDGPPFSATIFFTWKFKHLSIVWIELLNYIFIQMFYELRKLTIWVK